MDSSCGLVSGACSCVRSTLNKMTNLTLCSSYPHRHTSTPHKTIQESDSEVGMAGTGISGRLAPFSPSCCTPDGGRWNKSREGGMCSSICGCSNSPRRYSSACENEWRYSALYFDLPVTRTFRTMSHLTSNHQLQTNIETVLSSGLRHFTHILASWRSSPTCITSSLVSWSLWRSSP